MSTSPAITRIRALVFGLPILGVAFYLGRVSVHAPEAAPVPLATNNAKQSDLERQRNEDALASSLTASPSESLSAASLTRLLQAPATPASEQALIAKLKELVAVDPQLALRLAGLASTPRQRELFRNAALEGWAAHDARASIAWVLANLREDERRASIEAIATGAVAQPEAAVEAFKSLLKADPKLASDHGNSLLVVLARNGQFELASDFASSAPPDDRASWLCTVFNTWGMYQPEVALAALERMPNSAAREEARGGLFEGWSNSDPAALVAYAQGLPTGETRTNALREGLSHWAYRDAASASAWLDNFDPAPDLDTGAAAIALAPGLVEKKPDVAASWAESITDPELRSMTLMDLIQQWAQYDRAAARRFAASTPSLPSDKRQLALSSIESTP